MRLIIQRVPKASVSVDQQITGKIEKGLLILLGVEEADTLEDVNWLAKKVANMRIFADEEGKMNLSLNAVNGAALVVSQFTLHASTKKGNRPSFIKSANPEHAESLYLNFIEQLKNEAVQQVETGIFGAHMEIELINDGPVTIFMDSQNRE